MNIKISGWGNEWLLEDEYLSTQRDDTQLQVMDFLKFGNMKTCILLGSCSVEDPSLNDLPSKYT